MAIFAKDGADKATTTTKAPAPAGDGALSIVAAGMTVRGDIESSGVVKIEGTIEGTVRSARQVLIGRQGRVTGDIQTREAVIGGRIDGTVTASERVEVQGSAVVNGDIATKSIVVLEGAQLNGNVTMSERAGDRSAERTPVRAEEAKLPPAPVAVVR